MFGTNNCGKYIYFGVTLCSHRLTICTLIIDVVYSLLLFKNFYVEQNKKKIYNKTCVGLNYIF